MRGLDDTDREILRLLSENARQPYSEIAEAVDLSPPAVSSRVDRLRELGVLERFTVELDRETLRDGSSALVTVHATPGGGERVMEALRGAEAVEYLLLAADETVVCTVVAADVRATLAERLPSEAVAEYTVRPLAAAEWTPRFGQVELAPECVECGNHVGGGGERERLDGELYHFCCPSCQAAFLDRYERLREGPEADG